MILLCAGRLWRSAHILFDLGWGGGSGRLLVPDDLSLHARRPPITMREKAFGHNTLALDDVRLEARAPVNWVNFNMPQSRL